jgi:hypothetical protein
MRVLVYPHWFQSAEKKKIATKLMAENFIDDFDFVVHSKSIDSVDEAYVRKRIAELLEKYKNDEVKFAMVGYSPLVAVIYKIAKEYGKKTVYYVTLGEEILEREI